MTYLSFRLICWVLISTLFTVVILAQPKIGPTLQRASILEQDKPIVRELKADGIHTYALTPKAGQFVSVVVQPRTVDVVVLLFAPDGQRLAEVGSPNGLQASAKLSFVADSSGNYRVEVLPLEKVKTGLYEIHVPAMRSATSQEKDSDKVKRFAAAIAFADSEEVRAALLGKHESLITVQLMRELHEYGRVLRNQNKYSSALAVSRLALQLAEQMGDKIGIGDAIYNIGVIFARRRDFDPALEHFQKSVELYAELGHKPKLAVTIEQLAYIYYQQDNLSLAAEHFQRCLALDPKMGDEKRADLLYTIGSINHRLGRDADAIKALQESLILYRGTGNKLRQYNALGQIHYLQSNFSKSLEYNREALALSEAAGSNGTSAWTLNLMSLTSRMIGDHTSSMEYIEKALTLSETVDDNDLKVNLFMAAGLLHQALQNRMKALEFFQKSLILAEAQNNRTLIAYARQNIGKILFLEGHYAEAMDHLQKSLSLNQAVGSERHLFYTIDAIGSLYQKQGDHAQALAYRRRGLKLTEEIGNKFQILTALISNASLYNDIGDFPQALASAKRAEALSKEIGERENLPRSLYFIGLAYQGLKDFERSRLAFEEAVQIIELTRANIASPESRTEYFSNSWEPYEAYVDLVMQMHREQPRQGHNIQAFEITQRARARSLLELLNESRTQIDQGVAPELLARERALQKQLNERADQQMRLLNGKHTADQAELLKKDIESLSFEYRKNQAQIRLRSPRYAALTQPQPLTANEIQRDLLDTDTALLEYALGSQRSYLWVVTSTSLQSYQLSNRSEIENDVRRVITVLNDGKRWASDEKISTEFTQVAAALSRKLLPASVLSQLKGKRLAIVSDGVLHYLPFGALPLLTENNSNTKEPSPVGVPLSADFEIVNLPSASALAVQRSELPNRKQPTKSLAIFADPIFSETDERVPAIKADQSRISRPWKTDPNRVLLERAFNLGGKPGELFSIPRLPFTRSEAKSIFALAPKKKAIRALDFDADREKLLRTDLSKYRIIHFATHGILHSEHPELSGIVLSLVNEKGEPVNGFLRLNEIYNMNLNADLVVLSACQTALGKEVRGEGLIGLTRGFMYAGSPRVVASLWKVDDVATAELMKIFYQKILKEKMRPAAALRAAKIAMMKQKRWAAPYYWAAFELQGEWR
jgi:CHAT domain-containing protein/Tfp pilus assembly protein PilF